MFCGKCGSPVGDDAAFCPNCGAATKQAPAAEPVQEEVVQNQAEVLTPEANDVQENVQNNVQENVQNNEQPVAPAMDLNTDGYVPIKKKKSKAPILIGIVAVLAIAAVLIFLNWAKFSSFFARTVNSPEELQADVYADVVAERFDELAEMEEDSNFWGKEKTDAGMDAQLKLHIDEEILNMIPTQGVDISWLSDIAIGLDYDVKGELAKVALDLILGDTSIITAEAITNAESMEIYASVPELNDKALYVNIQELMEASGAMIAYDPAQAAKLVELIPETQTLEAMTMRYVDVLVSGFGKVEKSSEKIEVGGISQKLYVLTATMNAEDLLNMAENLLETLKDDEDIKAFLQDIEEFVGEEGLYDDFRDELEYALEDLEDVELEDMDGAALTLTTYLNDLNEIVGISLEVTDDAEETFEPFYWISVEQGKKFASEIVISDGYEDLVIEGSGEIGKAKNAVYEVSFDRKDILKVELVDYISNDKEKSGTIRVVPDEEIIEDMMYDIPDAIAGLIGAAEPAIELTFNSNDKGGSVSIALVVGKKSLLSISVSTEITEPDNITIPDDYIKIEDEYGIMEWAENINYDFAETLMDRLIQAGVPSELFGG